MNGPVPLLVISPEYGWTASLAWRVTSEDMVAISVWCGGEVEVARHTRDAEPRIEFPVKGEIMNCGGYDEPLYDAAFIGDWVVLEEDGKFCSYTDSCFHQCYRVVP